MRLFQIALSGQYKGLKDQSFNFDRNDGDIFALIGLNGSGKSQLLELIAEAFAYFERWQRDDFISGKGLGFGVTLHYEWDCRYDAEVLSRYDGILGYAGLAEFQVNIERDGRTHVAIREDGEWIPLSNEDKIPMPQVVGYASGLNENLQRSFMKNSVQQYEVRRVSAKRQKELSGKVDEERRVAINKRYVEKYPHIFSKMTNEAFDQGGYLDVIEENKKASHFIYIDYDNVSLLLLSLAVLPPKTIRDLFNELPFQRLHRAVIRYDLRTGVTEEDAVRDVKMLIRIAGEGRVQNTGQPTTDAQYEIYELDYLAGEITLDFLDQELLGRLREESYGDPLTLFNRLYNLQQLGVRNWAYPMRQELKRSNFFGAVKKPLKTKLSLSVVELLLEDGSGHTINLDDLSDGEAQLMQLMSAAFIFSRSQSLFLLDEPETHLNPSWRTYFHSHLKKSMSLGNEANEHSQIFISTHSPFMISSLKREDVRLFERGEDGWISMGPVYSQTYGTSFDVLIKEYFGLRSLISQSVVEDVKKHLKGIDQSDNHKARHWVEENLGDSMEKAYLLRKLTT